jgi:hypothetical protein
MEYIVVCRADREYTAGVSPFTGNPIRVSLPGDYVLTTRTTFTSRERADEYAKGIAPGREAIVVSGDFAGLRLKDAREFKFEPK